MKLKKLLKKSKVKREGSVKIAFGKLIFTVQFKIIKLISTISFIIMILNILYCYTLFASSVYIKNQLGDFINMISKGDGHILPSLQAVPTIIFLMFDCGFLVLMLKLFNRKKQGKINWILFILIVCDLVCIIVTFIIIIAILNHSYATHEELHNGISDAMREYSSNSRAKQQIDRLQIEFDCCGSKKYDEWYNITWYDEHLSRGNIKDSTLGNTPFSCCSMKSIFPCIHHNIENTGQAYLYTPEQNLSISTDGCYQRIRTRYKKIGWEIAGNLFLMQISQLIMLICLRFLQTGHYVDDMFLGHSKLYTIWLIGTYVGKNKEDNGNLVPPKPPPVPPELKK